MFKEGFETRVPYITQDAQSLKTLWDRMEGCAFAASEGRLGSIRADLPDHYVATDKVGQRLCFFSSLYCILICKHFI